MKYLVFIFSLAFTIYVNAQVLTVNPAFPTVNDVVTITYDATLGNAALINQNQIYCHTGLITTTSTSPTNWQYVQGTWGTADPDVAMTNIGNNKHQITIDIDQFYGVPGTVTVLKLAFVFRTANGSIVGREADGSDIYYDLVQPGSGLQAQLFSPNNNATILNLGESLSINGQSSQSCTLSLFEDGQLLATSANANTLNYNLTATTQGTHLLKLTAANGSEIVEDSAYYTVNPSITLQDPPSGTKNGINYINDSTVVLRLFAPEKEHVYVIGDFNQWVPSANYYMNLSLDSTTWWLTIGGLTPGQRYGYQYLIDGNLKLADPLSSLILDKNNDAAIGSLTNPNPHPYPTGLTTGFVTIMHPGATAYTWQNTNFTAPENKDLLIYEVLVRDFVQKRNYQTLIDTLDYLDKLGINAIELMPPGEFENNESWGYNPSFHMALDKYYGTPQKFKEFVDSCHGRGIAVIVDMVLNHAFGQNPMVNMYWDAVNNRPAANSPWFNAICPHEPYCWGYDFDHTRQATKDYIDRVNSFWLEEYNIDGFRFDYTKGFINNGNGFSTDRINILKRMADTIWSVKPNAYVILEHWCDNAEEKQLAEYGMMLWGNLTHSYNDATMGYTSTSNISNGIYTARTWTVPHLVTYMESHDEERLMYKNITFGSTANPNHNTKDEYIALGRMQTAAVIFFSQPGPRMIWQFGELGYDISIDVPCRVCNKPILWNYFTEARRRQLYDVYAAMMYLRNTYSTFTTLNFNYMLSGAVKRMKLNDPAMNAVVLTNFSVNNQDATPSFQHTGTWYEYFTGDSIVVSDVNAVLTMTPGEYRVYTDMKLDQPQITDAPATLDEIVHDETSLLVYPNPSSEFVMLQYEGVTNGAALIKILDQNGKEVWTKKSLCFTGKNNEEVKVENLPSGIYSVVIQQGIHFQTARLSIVK
ncbi:MAG: T9SS type A sorting domain-containing protein [Bacteroidetes bacterium]|nr:T9SS type A sorting domain-containing protein [Bacteroidota bacterium]